ncbi:alpha-ketoglutarate-dependent dioxygenase AlkB [Actinoallomurus sp. NPDC050550]|uniref:alpha-ketoglutarate-dependent dioxygenase AlkB n=1 Tax=Actinoallomurus sp. NPDC050550 TaxID=3154937 RepID=UPI0033C400A9
MLPDPTGRNARNREDPPGQRFTDPDRATRIPVRLEPGSLCVMTGPARYAWRHAIAARKSDPGPHGRLPRSRRVSITLRTVLPS